MHGMNALRWTTAGLLHRPVRAALAALAVAAGAALVALVLGFQKGFEASLARDVEGLGYQLLVTGKGCPHEAATLILRGGEIPMYVTDEMADFVAEQPEVAASTRFLLQVGPGAGDGETQLFVGADDAFVDLRPGATFQRGGWFTSPDAREVVAGYSVAEYRRLNLGDTVDVGGEPHELVGVFDAMGTQDDGTLFLPLARAQHVFERRDRVTGIGLRLTDPERAGPLIDRLFDTPSLQVVRMSAVQETVLRLMRGARGIFAALALIALFAAGACVLAATLVTQAERAGELGVMRALGASRGLLFRLAWTDALALGVLGGALCVPLALALRASAEAFVRGAIAFVPAGATVAPGARELLIAAGLSVVVALLGGVAPAWRASRRRPADTLRGGAV